MSSSTLTVKLDGTVIQVQAGDNLLTSLLENHLDVRYGCRAGACGACRLYSEADALLACQTCVSTDMSLTAKAPSMFNHFMLHSLQFLKDGCLALTLLGPSDDSFGDRVSVCFDSVNDDECILELMAVNQPGDPLTIVLQQALLPASVWQSVLSLKANDKVLISCETGVRKGRLLYELGLENVPIIVVSSEVNAVYNAFWQDALASVSCQLMAFHVLADEQSLDNENLTNVIKDAQIQANGGDLHILYHGQNRSEQNWQQVLRPLRIRTSQLHFIR